MCRRVLKWTYAYGYYYHHTSTAAGSMSKGSRHWLTTMRKQALEYLQAGLLGGLWTANSGRLKLYTQISHQRNTTDEEFICTIVAVLSKVTSEHQNVIVLKDLLRNEGGKTVGGLHAQPEAAIRGLKLVAGLGHLASSLDVVDWGWISRSDNRAAHAAAMIGSRAVAQCCWADRPPPS
ncbi:unnamed protein product, partial [Prunus brigantina]